MVLTKNGKVTAVSTTRVVTGNAPIEGAEAGWHEVSQLVQHVTVQLEDGSGSLTLAFPEGSDGYEALATDADVEVRVSG